MALILVNIAGHCFRCCLAPDTIAPKVTRVLQWHLPQPIAAYQLKEPNIPSPAERTYLNTAFLLLRYILFLQFNYNNLRNKYVCFFIISVVPDSALES